MKKSASALLAASLLVASVGNNVGYCSQPGIPMSFPLDLFTNDNNGMNFNRRASFIGIRSEDGPRLIMVASTDGEAPVAFRFEVTQDDERDLRRLFERISDAVYTIVPEQYDVEPREEDFTEFFYSQGRMIRRLMVNILPQLGATQYTPRLMSSAEVARRFIEEICNWDGWSERGALCEGAEAVAPGLPAHANIDTSWNSYYITRFASLLRAFEANERVNH